MRSPVIVIGAVVALIFVITTLTMFGMGVLLDDDGPQHLGVEGTRDGIPVTGTVTIEDTHESSREKVLRVTAELVCEEGTEVLGTYLFLGEDGLPLGSLNTDLGEREVDGRTVHAWSPGDSPGFVFCFDGTSVVAVIIQTDGYDCLAL